MKIIFALGLFALISSTVHAQDKPQLRLLSEVNLDLDGDGVLDRVVTVLVGSTEKYQKREDGGYWIREGETVDLYFYMKNGDKSLDLSATPTFVKKDVLDLVNDFRGQGPEVYPLQQKGKGSIELHFCHGCGANISQDETLTIVNRNGQFLVAGFSRWWDDNVMTSNGTFDTTTGECDINFLTGKGLASSDITRQVKPLKRKFPRIKLTDWSIEKYPKVCAD